MIVSSSACAVVRGGAHSAAPTTPTTIAPTAMYSQRPGALAEHPLADDHQHQQARRQRRLHDDQRREQQRQHLQRPAEHRQARADQPARTPDQAPRQRQAQVLLVGRLLGVHRLQRDP